MHIHLHCAQLTAWQSSRHSILIPQQFCRRKNHGTQLISHACASMQTRSTGISHSRTAHSRRWCVHSAGSRKRCPWLFCTTQVSNVFVTCTHAAAACHNSQHTRWLRSCIQEGPIISNTNQQKQTGDMQGMLQSAATRLKESSSTIC